MTMTALSDGTVDAVRFQRASALGVSTLHEASGGLGALPTGIRSMTQGLLMAGRAVTVSGPGGDNLWIHRGLAQAAEGDVLVVRVDDQHEFGYWGEVLSWAARSRSIAGLVIDGCVRDSDRLTGIGVPIFARGLCMKGTTKLPEGEGTINEPVVIGDLTVAAGDLIVGDGDGVVAIPAAMVDEVIARGVERADHESAVMYALQQGGSTVQLLGLPQGRQDASSTD